MIITMKADLTVGTLKAFENTLDISCIVRNEINGWRKKNEVVYSIPDNKPIQPRQFPKGAWTVGEPKSRSNPYLAPVFISTNAWQYLPVWKLDSNKCYLKATKEIIKDEGYGLHFSTSTSTQGCIRIGTVTNLLWLVKEIKKHQTNGDVIMLEVV